MSWMDAEMIGMNTRLPDVRNRGKTRVNRHTGLAERDWVWLCDRHPDLGLAMLRNRFDVANMSLPSTWLAENCKGLYYSQNAHTVYFELEEDAILLKMTFDGKS